MTELLSLEEMEQAVGNEYGPSDWLKIDQEQINKFAEATHDHQFIHVDPEAAKATPFGATIAHGYLTMSLMTCLTAGLMPLPKNLTMVINYGLNKLRFLTPVKVESEIRAHLKIIEARPKGKSRILVTNEITIEIKGEKRPALIAESLVLFLTAAAPETEKQE